MFYIKIFVLHLLLLIKHKNPEIMKKVISDVKNITVKKIADELQFGNGNLIVMYYTRSDEPYPAFLKSTGSAWGFVNPTCSYKDTYCSGSAKASIELAIAGGKELLVCEKSEYSKIFKKA